MSEKQLEYTTYEEINETQEEPKMNVNGPSAGLTSAVKSPPTAPTYMAPTL